MARLLQFHKLQAQMPRKRSVDERADDFDEIYDEFENLAGQAQAGRCSQCGVPFCQSGCPLGNDIPEWLALAAEGRMREAYELSASTSTMPEICGRICPQDRLCEGACVVEQAGHGAITIGAAERFITETAWDNGWVEPLVKGKATGQSVGIVGSGPAGLSAAERLIERGHDVVVYERADRPGGLLIYGIPNFKLDKHVVERRTERLAGGTVEFVLNTEVGVDVSFAELQARHDAVLVATGVYEARDLAVPGAGPTTIVPAMRFLTAENRRGLHDRVSEDEPHAEAKNVVVIGGGDTAMDCVRTAIRQGARSVTCLYRRDRENMPGSQREVTNAEEEGVVFEWLTAPRAITADSVIAQPMRLGAPGPDGRRRPEAIEGEHFTVPADMVIAALGYEAEDLAQAFRSADLGFRKDGTLRVRPATFETAMDGVFAAGDIARGASLVVHAVKDGMDAAQAIDRYLRRKGPSLERQRITDSTQPAEVA